LDPSNTFGAAVTDAGRLCLSCQSPIPGDVRICPSCGAISLPRARGTLGEAVADRLRAALGKRYRVERELGEGGMAVVYLAHDLRHDRPVALKVLRPELSAFLGAERFLREIHVAAQLNHPHIITLHDSGEADGLLFYVMPYVEGASLRHLLGAQGSLAIPEAVALAAEVADGLSYAHARGVVHRDIKPENILLAHGHAAIADFGIARALVGAGPAITMTGMSLGTPIYMSPEQAMGDPALDHRADIYSLGCVLHETLTGNPPYPGETPQALMAEHATSPVPSARALRPEVPAALDAAVRRALAKAPADRFQTAGEFREAIEGVRGAGGAALPGAPPRSAVTRRRLLTAVAAVAVVAVGAALLLRSPSRPAPPAARLRVVVRPFDDRTGGLGAVPGRITEVLTERLQSVPALDVTAAGVVAELRNTALDTLWARFDPDRIVMGRVDRQGDSLRVSADVLAAGSATALAHQTVTVPAGDASAAESLSVFLRHEFSAELDSVQRRARVRNAAAWGLVSHARELSGDAERAIFLRLDRQGFHSLDLADSLLGVARGVDGASDLIPIEQARIAERRAFYVEYLRQNLPDPPGALPDAVRERQRGLATLDRLIASRHGPADAYQLRGRLREGLYRERQADSLLDGAIADYRAATELDRHRPTAWMDLGSAYRNAGLFADALLAIQHAVDEDAFLLFGVELLRSRFDGALLADRADSAEMACRTGLRQMPPNPMLADCEVELWSKTRGDRRLAAAARTRVEALAPGAAGTVLVPLRELWVAQILARAGLRDSADRVARRATARAPGAWQVLLLPEQAYLRILRHDPDSALALIAAEVRLDPNLHRFLRAAPWFRPLQADPRFEAALAGTLAARPSPSRAAPLTPHQ
jgi:eukaryotic-like serine/threonine-protein kinase